MKWSVSPKRPEGLETHSPFSWLHFLFQASSWDVLLPFVASCSIFHAFHAVIQEKGALPSPWIIVNSLWLTSLLLSCSTLDYCPPHSAWPVLEGGKSKKRYGQGRFVLKALLLACSWPPSFCVPLWPLTCVHTRGVRKKICKPHHVGVRESSELEEPQMCHRKP